jgi:hypothetical protein
VYQHSWLNISFPSAFMIFVFSSHEFEDSVSNHGFHCIHPTWIYSFPSICRFIFLLNLGRFHNSFFKYIFSFVLFLSFWELGPWNFSFFFSHSEWIFVFIYLSIYLGLFKDSHGRVFKFSQYSSGPSFTRFITVCFIVFMLL